MIIMLLTLCKLSTQQANIQGESSTWLAPDVDWIKVNVDASYIKELGNCSLGCIARNHEGKVLWACNQPNINCEDAFEAEARACRLGLQRISDRSTQAVILESDNAAMVEAIQKQNQVISSLLVSLTKERTHS
jgi:ribonuclease HI